MVSIDALVEVLEVVHKGDASLKVERCRDGYLATDSLSNWAAAGHTPTEAIANFAAKLQKMTESDAAHCAAVATAAAERADAAKRLAIQAKHVVDGFAQGASE